GAGGCPGGGGGCPGGGARRRTRGRAHGPGTGGEGTLPRRRTGCDRPDARRGLDAPRRRRGANWDALKLMIAEWMVEQSVEELYQLLQKRRVPLAPVSTMGDLLSSKHLNARGFFVSFATPAGRTYRYPGAPYLFSRTPWQLRRPAPRLGEHRSEVMAELGLGGGHA
ncbi:MAG: CoA transferase, partial [Candidatus Binatia bacterium]